MREVVAADLSRAGGSDAKLLAGLCLICAEWGASAAAVVVLLPGGYFLGVGDYDKDSVELMYDGEWFCNT